MIWFTVREHFLQNICDLIFENGLLIKLLKQQFCIHPVPIYVQLFIITVCIQNCFLKCFNSCPFSKIISNILSIINLSVSTMIYIVFSGALKYVLLIVVYTPLPLYMSLIYLIQICIKNGLVDLLICDHFYCIIHYIIHTDKFNIHHSIFITQHTVLVDCQRIEFCIACH